MALTELTYINFRNSAAATPPGGVTFNDFSSGSTGLKSTNLLDTNGDSTNVSLSFTDALTPDDNGDTAATSGIAEDILDQMMYGDTGSDSSTVYEEFVLTFPTDQDEVTVRVYAGTTYNAQDDCDFQIEGATIVTVTGIVVSSVSGAEPESPHTIGTVEPDGANEITIRCRSNGNRYLAINGFDLTGTADGGASSSARNLTLLGAG